MTKPDATYSKIQHQLYALLFIQLVIQLLQIASVYTAEVPNTFPCCNWYLSVISLSDCEAKKP